MRCFVAIELESPIRQALTRMTLEFRGRGREVRWCAEQDLHVTLKFLGEIAERYLPQVIAISTEAARSISPFTIKIADLGGFPARHWPRILWAGVHDPTGRCAAWLSAADPAFESLGVPRETRAFHAHVTLARSLSPVGNRQLADILASAPPLPAMDMRVAKLTLFESRKGSGGAKYAAIAQVPL